GSVRLMSGLVESGGATDSLAHDLDDESFVSLPVQLRVKNSLPWSEVEPPAGDGHDHLMMNEESFEMRVPVVLSGFMVLIVGAKRRQLLQPLIDIFNQSRFIVIHVNSGRNVHGGNKHHPFFDSTFFKGTFNLGSDVDVFTMLLSMKSQVLSMEPHGRVPP